jgi:hypothetical protein
MNGIKSINLRTEVSRDFTPFTFFRLPYYLFYGTTNP